MVGVPASETVLGVDVVGVAEGVGGWSSDPETGRSGTLTST